jgi:tRNA/tmRNA/rRNA uracil-C5-methylase (TrmA/RlmC/RlmD family)
VARNIFRRIKEFIAGERILDLYCGVGAITLYMASEIDHAIGVESVKEAVDLAGENAFLNGINKTEFHCQPVQDYLKENQERPDTVIADPPRKGLGKKAIKRVLESGSPRLIIMSCNPRSLKQDMGILSEKYQVNYLQAFDMFPYTDHMEMLTVLDKKQR